MRRTLGIKAPAVMAKQAEIDALDHELARLPELNSEVSKLLRTLRVYERTHTFLFAQLQEARIEEARDTPTVDVLDMPFPPQEKSWPKRTYIVLLSFAVSIILSMVLAKGLDSWGEARRRLEIEGA